MHGKTLALRPQGDQLVGVNDDRLTPAYADYDDTPKRGIDLQALWWMVVRNRGLMLAIMVVALLVGTASIWLPDPVYTAQTTIQIEPQPARVLGTEDIKPDLGASENTRTLQTQVDLMSSRSTAEHVVRQLNLADDPQFLREAGLEDQPAGPFRAALAAYVLQAGLNVSSPRDTRLIAVQYDSHDPVRAARIANSFADTYINDTLQRRLDTFTYSRNFLHQQIAQTKGKLEKSERNLVNYAVSAGLVDAANAAGAGAPDGERRSITTASLVDLNSAYSQAQANRMQAQQRWQQAMATPVMSLPEVLSNSAIQDLTRQRAVLESALQQDRQRRQDDHPAIMQAKAQIAEMDRQIGAIAAGVRASLANQYRVAAGQEAAIAGRVGALKAATFAEQGKDVRYNILKREVDTNRNLYNTLLQRYSEVSTQVANTANPVSIIDRAQVPAAPSYPRPALNMALAGLAGAAMALMAGFLRTRMDDKVHGPTDVESDFRTPLLGVVPLLKGDGRVAEAMDDPLSSVTEAHHAICLALDPVVQTPDRSVLLLTSSSSNEGKSTIAVKIATSLAGTGKNVLLIDGDMRRGSLHLLLGLSNELGLADLLGKGSDAALAEAVQHLERRGFSVLTRGSRSSASPAELLANSRFAALLDEAASQYDAIILDAPPVLGLADAPRISGMADATVFVVEANRTSKADVKIALKRLGDAGADQIGLVISKYDPAKDVGAYGYAYHYDYPLEEDRIADKEPLRQLQKEA
ncbi:GumC family protein [Sphingobium mellinum]|uniref:GumC family protein n=1 Tax=Sphingobium mellinum TaxID=1387166 RepID=UPI0030EDE075